MVGIEVQRLAVERRRLFHVAGFAVREAHQVVHVRMLHGRQDRRQFRDGTGKILGFDLGAHGREIRRVFRDHVIDGQRRASKQH
jgi:hypothetical protein